MMSFLKSLFGSGFILCSMGSWLRGIYQLAFSNNGLTSVCTIFVTGSVTLTETLWQETIFGTTYFVLLLVLGTVLVNTASGIKKNNLKAAIFFAKAQLHEYGTVQHKINIRKWENHKFEIRKTLFVGFKFLSFMSYLLVAKTLMTDTGAVDGDNVPWEIKALAISTEILIRVPIAIFWYYEFKSIGENSEYIFGKKASIFSIVEGIFEPRIFKFFGTTTPTDGVHHNTEINPRGRSNEDDLNNDVP